MNKRKFFLLILLPILAGCETPTYSFVNPPEPQKDLKPAVEEGMVMDGLMTEGIYATADSKTFTGGANNDVNAKVTVAFAEKGLLVYAKVTKENNEFYENIDLDIFKQDSFELYINPSNFQDELNAGCVQFRLSPRLRRETWIGQKDVATEYTWTKYYKPFNYGTHVDGLLNTSRGKDIVKANYVGYEYYIPYSSIGLDYNPKGLAILPAFVNASSVITGNYKWYSYDNVQITEITRYPIFGNKEFRDQTGNIINTDYCDVGYDLSHQKSDVPYVIQSGWNDQYARINIPTSNNFDVKVDMDLIKGLQNDLYPKVGLCIRNNFGKIALLLDPRQSKDNYEALVVNRAAGDEAWDWEHAPIFFKGEETYNKPIRLEIIRRENTIYYIMNDMLAYVGNAGVINNDICDVYLLSMNYCAQFYNIYTELDVSKIDDRLKIFNIVDYNNSTNGYSISEESEIIQKGIHDQWLMFNYSGTKYEFSVDVKLGSVFEHDLYPKIGIAEQDANKIQCLFIDPHEQHDNFEACSATGSSNPEERNWQWKAGSRVNFDMNDFINLKMIRDGLKTTYFVNGYEVYSFTNSLTGSSKVMLFTMNHGATYKNINFINK